MAAPSGTTWGSIVGGYGRIGIYTSLSSTDATTTLTVQIWFWSKYSVSDTKNNLYFDNLAASGSASSNKGSVSISTTVASGSGWSSSNQKQLKSYSYSYTRGTASSTRYLYSRLDGVDRVGGKMYASKTVTIPALASYTISYNANGGSGAPSAQTKYYGKNITLSSSKPTRTGYTFKGWGTSSSTSTVSYAAGATYSANASITLYAIWTKITYTVSYNANGGSGAPGNQTKTYGVNLTLSSTKPTRTNYNFKGWGTSASATTVSYAAGATYTANAALKLYAIWEIAYIKPRITGYSAIRCDADGNASDEGTYAKVAFSWATDKTVSSVKIEWKTAADVDWSSVTVSSSGTSGSVTQVVGDGAISTESAYTIRVTVADASGSNLVSMTIGSMAYPIDILAGGKGVAIGKVAEEEGYLDVDLESKFRKAVKSLNTDGSAFRHANQTTGTDIRFGIGSDGYSRGIWDAAINRWMLSGDKNNNIMLNGENTKLAITGSGSCYLQRIDGNAGAFLTLGKYGGLVYEDSGSTFAKINLRFQTAAGSGWKYSSVRDIVENDTLWTGAYHMNANQSCTLTRNVLDQTNGIVLIWSYYDNANTTAKNQDFDIMFIPKAFVSLYSGCGFWISNPHRAIAKYVYVSNTTVRGNSQNSVTTAVNGVNRSNNLYCVLRAVIGV